MNTKGDGCPSLILRMAPPEIVGEAARRMLQEAKIKYNGSSDTVDGWKLTSHAAHPENEMDMARLWNVWWEYTQKDAIFFGVPDGGAFVAALKN